MNRTQLLCAGAVLALALSPAVTAEPPKPLDLGDGLTMELVPIPAGKFLMGSPGDEDGVKLPNAESPQHEVTISRPFLMGKYLLTQEQFAAVMGDWKFSDKLGIGPKLPAHSFSWGHGQSFCQKLSASTARTIRMPTEAEWEYACRAGTTTRYFHGDDAKGADEYAWHNGNSGRVLKAVGLLKPNPWGLYDINGLMCEYCSDWFSPDAYTNEKEIDPKGPPFSPGGGHVLRSGVYNMGGANWCRSACRLYDTGASGNHGLRVVVEIPDAAPLEGAEPDKPAPRPATPLPEIIVRDLPKTSLDLGGGVKLEMVLLPAGEFLIGTPLAEPGRRAGERPQREVTISKPFHLGTCELTQAQYQAVMGKSKQFRFPGPANPADSLSRKDAEVFCTKLSGQIGKAIRLPTEAEWEYACRAGTKTAFCFGDDRVHLDAVAWYDGNAGAGTHPVGRKRPNAFGLYDMHGNVWEYCSDHFSLDAYAKMADTADPKGPSSGWYTNRSMRGGGFDTPARDCRSGRRGMFRDPYAMPAFGMRVVMEAAR